MTGAQVGAGRGRVCHLSSVHRTNDIRIFHKECVTLAAAGFDTTLIAVAAPTPDRGVRVVGLPDGGNRLQRMIGRARHAYRLAVETNAQIYHFHDPELLPWGYFLKKRTGAKVVFDSHECFREDVVAKNWIPAPLRGSVGHAVGAIEDFVVARIDQVVAATPHIAHSFRHAREVVTINNYPLPGEFTPAAAADAGGRRGICYVGAISEARGILPLLDALSLLDEDIPVHVAGPFAGDAIERAVRSHPNWHRVTFYGHAGRNEVARIYAACYAGVVTFLPVPNHVHSQPNKLFEYMSAGLPAICSNFALWRRLVEDEGCGLCVDPADPAAIASAIQTLRQDPARTRAMADRGVRLIRDRYNWTREGERLVSAYDELLAR